MTSVSGPQWPALCAGALVVPGTEQVLWRQVHPQFVDDDIVGVGAFVGVSDDRQRVSTSLDGVQTSAGAYAFHVALGLESAGTWPVTTRTVADGGGRTVYDAEAECHPTPCPPGHAVIDMRVLMKRQQKELRSSLAAEATTQGCAYRP